LYTLTDGFGQELHKGDFIIYNVKHSTWIDTKIARIEEVIDNGEDVWKAARYQVKVVAFDPDHWGKLPNGEYGRLDRIYRTTLTSNRNIIRLVGFKLPKGFVELLHASVV